MQSISVYKNIAANALSGNWGKCALATLVYFIIMELPSWLAMPNNELYSYSYSGYSGYSLLYIVFVICLMPLTWGFLSVLTLGIGFLFLVPYNYTAHAAFYEELKAEQPAAEIEFTV